MILLDISGWWDAMSVLERVYWGFAIPSTTAFLIILVLAFIGIGGDADVDMDTDADFDGADGTDAVDAGDALAFQFFTVKNMIAFFTLFSWTGLASIKGGYSLGLTLTISVVCGLLMMLIMAGLFYIIARMVDSGSLNMKNALGKTGQVYIPIKASRGNIGKISVKIQGSLRELDAMTDEKDDLPTGTVVLITRVMEGNILIVERSR